MQRNVYPFSAIIGQENLKEILFLNAINPAICEVLIHCRFNKSRREKC